MSEAIRFHVVVLHDDATLDDMMDEMQETIDTVTKDGLSRFLSFHPVAYDELLIAFLCFAERVA